MKNHNSRRLRFEILESRVLFSASLAPSPNPDGGGAGEAGSPVQEQPAAPASAVEESETPPADQGVAEFGPSPDGAFGEELGPDFDSASTDDTGTVVAEVQQEQVEAIGEAAADIWNQSGINQEQRERLSQISYSVENFEGAVLGAANGTHVFIDIDAAGAGWFVESTPIFSDGFESAGSATQLFGETSGARSSIDLLTVILHEQGHVLGLSDGSSISPDVMNSSIVVGERLLPFPGQGGGGSPSSSDGTGFAVAGSGIMLDSPAFPIQVAVGETATILGSFLNTTGAPVTVELLDEGENVIDSVIVDAADTDFSLSVTPAQEGTLKVTIFAYDPRNPATNFDSADVVIQVTPAAPVVPPPTPLVATPVVATPVVTVVDPQPATPVAPVAPPVEAPLNIIIPPANPVAITAAQLGFLAQFGGTGDLSQQLYGPGGLFSINLTEIVLTQLLKDSDPADFLRLLDSADTLSGLQNLNIFGGDLNILSSISLLDRLTVNSQSLGLARVDITPSRVSSYVDYAAGSFLEASAIRSGSLPPAFASGSSL